MEMQVPWRPMWASLTATLTGCQIPGCASHAHWMQGSKAHERVGVEAPSMAEWFKPRDAVRSGRERSRE